jgi:hypothetical protein
MFLFGQILTTNPFSKGLHRSKPQISLVLSTGNYQYWLDDIGMYIYIYIERSKYPYTFANLSINQSWFIGNINWMKWSWLIDYDWYGWYHDMDKITWMKTTTGLSLLNILAWLNMLSPLYNLPNSNSENSCWHMLTRVEKETPYPCLTWKPVRAILSSNKIVDPLY